MPGARPAQRVMTDRGMRQALPADEDKPWMRYVGMIESGDAGDVRDAWARVSWPYGARLGGDAVGTATAA